MKISPRLAQFTLSMTDAQLDAVIAVAPAMIDLHRAGAEDGSELLRKALSAVFQPDNQVRQVLRHFMSIARAHAQFHFDTDEKYLAGLYAQAPWGKQRSPATCFTGLPGVGKTEILHAFARLLLLRIGTFCVNGHRDIQLAPSWAMTLAKGDGLNQLLRGHVEPASAEQRDECEPGARAESTSAKAWKIPELMRAAERLSWRSATCFASIDEFQWIAAGSNANARAATVLLKLHGIGPLLNFCSNYSLVHKLKRRPAEDRDRLLARPIVLDPLAVDHPDWITYLSAIRLVAPTVLVFDPQRDAEAIHLYTFGIKRKVIDLIAIAFLLERRRRSVVTIGVAELLHAYRSAAYAMHRDDVEILIRQRITGKMEREDLWCPFTSVEISATNVTTADPVVKSFETRTEEAILASALMPAEVAAHEKLKPECPERMSPAKVLRFPRQKVTKESLLAGAATLDEIE